MDEKLVAVGDRIRSRIPSGMSQRQLADQAGMKPDALSRALNGQRGFSSAELARIADELGADLYWLATGHEDPRRVQIAARHSWDPDRRVSMNPGRVHDDEILAQVVEVYNAALPEGPPPSEKLPDDPGRMREILGDDFVRTFGAAVEARLGVDVVRLPGLSTDYSITIGPRAVVLLATTPSWFRSNWSLAHELAHLALGHHSGNAEPAEKDEAPANRFAAELLLPQDLIDREDWQRMDERQLAGFLWRTGVSSKALKNRLDWFRIQPAPGIVSALRESTPKLIRAQAQVVGGTEKVTVRQQDSSTRLFPSLVVDALQRRVDAGTVSPELLAWALAVPVDEIDFLSPDDEQLADAYARRLEDRPSAADLGKWAASNNRLAG
ncbi:ImmA/IrrE family metallo-endopeptidase [Nocardia cyriacigeorgica]|uniref:ImmA/IrrE family metallo-endopeptidase n=1 Tax=Nocardia cyriacigeorgica TaxID=135487 RepID=A0A6P1CUV8_9NOCA|nr:XRE family transcriptional regulator [Nocardia cyriacigeorgica]NEW33895.1 ImmA/IrrE family metallo-endopeptidase [Nocardia cyriacigeorgica]